MKLLVCLFFSVFTCFLSAASDDFDTTLVPISSKNTFSDSVSIYDVDQILRWATENKNQWVKVETSHFLGYMASDSWSEPEDESTSSNLKYFSEHSSSHYKRAMKADLSYPIILTNFLEIVDGVHRVFKAVHEKIDHINAIFIDRRDLNRFRLIPFEEEALSLIPNMPTEDYFVRVNFLPDDEIKRRTLIEGYFSEHLPTATRQEDHWHVRLERPSTPYGNYEYDLEIREALAWWKQGTRIRDIPFEKKFLSDNFFLAIEDQWMPLSWSHFFKRLGHVPNELVLLHIDDHKDTMSPRVGNRLDGKFVDYITGNSISLLDPESVDSAVRSGAIGKGSILTLLIWGIEKIHIRHLSCRPSPSRFYVVKRVPVADPLLCKISNRISISLEETSSTALLDQSNYTITHDTNKWLEQVPRDVPTFLHIDMDYFNDCFDGDSEWQSHDRIHNPDLETQQKMLGDIFKSLREQDLLKQIREVDIGISPSFYPGRFWKPMVERLIENCRSMIPKI
jgi:hypothetical protein